MDAKYGDPHSPLFAALNMTPFDGKLIALKAIFLGHAASAEPVRARTAHAMATAAIAKLKYKRKPELQLRLAFYHLLRAEILRYGQDPLPDRLAAQKISLEIGSDLFDQFMRVESVTGHLPDPALRYGTGDKHRLMTAALNRLQVRIWWLSKSQREFLESVTLVEILHHHRVAYAANHMAP